MARRSMIPAGSVLGGVDSAPSAPGLLGQVIGRDRERSGRDTLRDTSPPPPDTKDVEDLPIPSPNNTPNPNITSNTESNITSSITAHTGSNEARLTASREDAPQSYQEADNLSYQPESRAGRKSDANLTDKPTRNAVGQKTMRQGGLSAEQLSAKLHARELAATTAVPITLRMPNGLNDWLDEYAHQHRKKGVKKQDLIAAAVQLLVEKLDGGVAFSDLFTEER